MTATTAPSATSMETKARPWWLMLINGILAVVVGGVMLWGNRSTKLDLYMFLIWFLGFWWVFRGIFEIVYMFIDHTAWGWKLFMGIISIIAGSYILTYPIVSALALPKIFVWVLGFWGLMEGIILLIMAFKGGGWGAGILGALSIIFGCVLIANAYNPGWGLSLIWTASVFALVGGVFMIVRSFQERTA